MPRDKTISLAEAARLIPDGATVTVSSSSGLGCAVTQFQVATLC